MVERITQKITLVRFWLIGILGGVPSVVYGADLHRKDILILHHKERAEKFEQDYRAATERIKGHILQESFGRQQFLERREHLVGWLQKAVQDAVKDYFKSIPELKKERWG